MHPPLVLPPFSHDNHNDKNDSYQEQDSKNSQKYNQDHRYMLFLELNPDLRNWRIKIQHS